SFSGAAIAPNSIVAAFGLNMANGIQGAMTLPLPLNMLGTSVKVRDSAGVERDASLFYVSPGQINYLVPAETALGAATATVFRDNISVGSGQMQITPVAPGLFSANADGAGVAAANATRVVGESQTLEPIIQPGIFPFVPLAIDLGPDDHQVFLSFFGTGFRARSELGAVRVTIGGTDVPVAYAGPQGDFFGLDQLNVGPIPRSLIGRGIVDVLLTVDGIVCNRVQASFK
ncbi:MAG: hypothetical protein L0226_10700, partial [Acidobacteria bacterium]|nr:hypothetical protein [Acidobacteriota bacterium]